MKKVVISSLVLSISIILSCTKTSNIQISPDNLTVCPKNSKCSYLFTEQADVEVFQIKSGPYRLFWSSIENDLGSCSLTSTLWIKAPMNKNTFSLNTEDIKKGLVNYSQVCICCNLIGLKPISGYVKGVNTTPEKSADQTKWLIEAEIVLAAIHNNKPIDTLYVKQFFVYN